MSYKLKPKKSMLKRFKVTGTGKLKHHRTHLRHLLSERSSDMKRRLAQPMVLSEHQAPRIRRMMGVAGLHPGKVAHERRLRAEQQEVPSEA